MKRNITKLTLVIAFFMILLFAVPAVVPALTTNHANSNSVSNINALNSSLTFNTSTDTRLVYSVDKIMNGSDNFFTIQNGDMHGSYQIGTINQSDTIGFDFQTYGVNGTGFDYVQGEVRGPNLDQPAQVQYEFVDAADVFFGDNGPPMLYFVIPNSYFNYGGNFTGVGFTSLLNSTNFTLIQNLYQKNTDLINITVSWSTDTGALQYYNYVEWGSGQNVSLVLSYQGSANPGALNPDFSMGSPTIFYNLPTLQVGSSNTLDFNSFNSTDNHGQIDQDQNVMVQLHTYTDSHGPNYEGEMRTLTGYATIGNPFSDNGTSDGPPDLVFILPVSSDPTWWNTFTTWISVEGLHKVSETATEISYQQKDSSNSNNNVTLTFNKTTGLLTHYKLLTVDAFELPGTSTKGVLNLELSFLSVYDLDAVNPSWGVAVNQQYKYKLDILNINGSTTTDAETGTYSQGQDFHIKFDALSLTDGPNVTTTMSTTTGQSHSNVNYDIFNQNDGPVVFLPVLPLDSNGIVYNYFADVFNYIVGAQVTNNATTFGIKVDNIDAGSEMHINHLYVFWNKSTGLLKSYDFDANNPTDPSQVLKLKMHYLGNSTGETVFTGVPSTSSTGSTSTISAPGFDFLYVLFGFITLGIILRQRKSMKL